MNKFIVLFSLIAILISCSSNGSDSNDPIDPNPNITNSNVNFYLTKGDKSQLLSLQPNPLLFSTNVNESITVNPEVTYQEMDGFGFSLTGGSALHLNNMSTSGRSTILNELFGEDNLAVSYLRVSIGASDLDAEPFTYNDLPAGETDENLEQFSISKDQEHLIPVLNEILEINPNIKIMGSPWSAPAWMKTNNNSIGGSLKPEHFSTYANYFVKYIQAYEAEGITIDAITVQNEPYHDGNNPSMFMELMDQTIFIKDHLGPAFETANIDTKIIIWDHNADNTWYATSILDDADANAYIDGSAFHLYNGSINNLTTVHNAYPDKNLYFTEQWVGVNSEFDDNLLWHTRELIVGASRNWCKTVLEWNLASNPNLEPHTQGGCTECLGGITINGNNVERNVGYYIIGHASKFVRPGSHRIASNYSTDLPNVAFKTLTGNLVVIVVNNTEIDKSFNIKTPRESISTTLEAGAVGTYVW
ncbi:glycoside hydrolase family 30 protein [Winogradskyella bathintestinalis]|uniref:Glycoside hydrolase family 30 beta sandwich domain-containing protein n=1 Tax=Winogradskyella bathintestinalis TaxID=3035208 RepID=A0ABT7ZRE7_9FLAO|nr:glycoside hydrolase family 30 beta sandwich domain-containing protein [Winogradskyella bathintestinalis]MDN3491567.1 glycoside hydrolase family 30 beta sandwich domain-containing protein [Winogradskyella bathintestinalis]